MEGEYQYGEIEGRKEGNGESKAHNFLFVRSLFSTTQINKKKQYLFFSPGP